MSPQNPPFPSPHLPKVHAIVVNWNGRRHLMECLSSLARIEYPASHFEITVVDNASVDGSQAAVKKEFPRATLVENPENLGYVSAVNLGARAALDRGADFLWIFNNDVVVYPDTLFNLLKVAGSDSAIAVAGPLIYSYDTGNLDHSGYKINLWTGYLQKLRYGVDVFVRNEASADVDSILGCSNLIRSEAWRSIGPFDSIYDIYFEETEFNLRVRQSGRRVVVVRSAAVRHKSSATMNAFLRRRAWLLLRNLFIFQCRNAGTHHLFVFIPYYFLVHIPYFLVRGLWHGLSIRLHQYFLRS